MTGTERRPSDRRGRLLSVPVALAVLALLVVAPRAQATGDQFLRAATLTNAAGVAGDLTGSSVAVSADGSTSPIIWRFRMTRTRCERLMTSSMSDETSRTAIPPFASTAMRW